MINISKNYKKFQFIWMRIMFFLAILYGLTMPGMIAADDGEKNYFTIYLNEAKIGATDSLDNIDEIMAKARRIIAGDSTELIYARMDLEVVGEAENGEVAVRLAKTILPDIVVIDLVMPVIGMLVGGVNFTDLKLTLKGAVPEQLNEAGEVIQAAVPAVTLNYGNFLQQTFDFLIIAFSIFLFISLIKKVTEKKKVEEAPAPAPAPEPSAEEKLLTEIRDLLKNK